MRSKLEINGFLIGFGGEFPFVEGNLLVEIEETEIEKKCLFFA